MSSAGPRVIVALDYADREDALSFVARITPDQARLKVGLELFTAAGPGIVGALVDRGFDVFLDLKYHDIPNTVAMACARAAGLGVWMLNVHALGGPRMLEAAREAVSKVARPPRLIAVTILTSHSDDDLRAIGLAAGAEREVPRLAQLARNAGLDGVVCSPLEAAGLRRALGPEFLLVTPGVRPAGGGLHDQRRVMTPVDAIGAGSDYLVIGRPITGAADPAAALVAINAQLGSA